MAHVATASFLASRASPTAGFWIALAGGLALARAGQRFGARVGYGASVAAMAQTVAIMGPPRFSVPLTQAVTAPLLGVLEARRKPMLAQIAICAAIRLLQNAAFLAFFVLVLAGGIDAYADSYSSVLGLVGLPESTHAALVATAVGLLAWALFGSTVQVLVYLRGLRRWPERGPADDLLRMEEWPGDAQQRFDPRAVAMAAIIAFALLLSRTSWPLLAAVAAWLVLASLTSRPDLSAAPVGAALALVLGGSVFAVSLLAGVGVDLGARRAVRATLLVLTATWMRAAAGANGLRAVARRTLARLDSIPPAREAAAVMDDLGAGMDLGPAARSALGSIRSARKRPVAVLDAVLNWVASEAAGFRAARSVALPTLVWRARDAALLGAATAPALALLA
jgi:hypothetical protein